MYFLSLVDGQSSQNIYMQDSEWSEKKSVCVVLIEESQTQYRLKSR